MPAQPAKFDVAAARSLGVPPGKLYGALCAGASVTLDDGSIVTPPQAKLDRNSQNESAQSELLLSNPRPPT